MEPVIVVIPNYIRYVKTSEKRKAIYYEFVNGLIKTKHKLIPDKYLTQEGLDDKIHSRMSSDSLKFPYMLAAFDSKNRIAATGDIIDYLKDGSIFYDLDKTKHRIFVIDIKTKQKLIANPKTVGTPNNVVINAQGIYSGNIQKFTKEHIMTDIKKSFLPYIQNIKPIQHYPVRIRLYLFDSVKNLTDNSLKEGSGMRWDIINRSYMYMKAFGDLLVEGMKDKSIHVPKILLDDERLYVTEDGGCVFCPITNTENRRLVFIIAPDDANFAKVIKPYEDERQFLIKNDIYYKEIQANNGKHIEENTSKPF